MTSYLVSGFDIHHAWLDTDPQNRDEGYPTVIEGAGAMLEFIRSTRTGVLHNFDAETHTTRRVAYWQISVGGVIREVYLTPWGIRYHVQPPDQGPGCRPAYHYPDLRKGGSPMITDDVGSGPGSLGVATPGPSPGSLHRPSADTPN